VKKLFSALLVSLVPLFGFANQDQPAPATFIHTKHSLPPPWHTGEIMARADYRGERNSARLHSLTITIGKDVIRVPERIRAFFPAVNLETFEMRYEPRPKRGPFDHRYVVVMFRFWSLPEYGIFASPIRPNIGWIVVIDGRIDHLEKIEEVSDTVTMYTEYNPKTLKETGKTSTTRVQ
jgi:hypothetical protein